MSVEARARRDVSDTAILIDTDDAVVHACLSRDKTDLVISVLKKNSSSFGRLGGEVTSATVSVVHSATGPRRFGAN